MSFARLAVIRQKSGKAFIFNAVCRSY